MNMSDNQDLDSKNPNDETGGICRDFQRGLCDRTRCKYKHEKSNDTNIPTLLFCHDFQNNCCPRPVCKFIHCTVAEEENYKRTGELAPHLQLEAVRKQQLYMGSIVPVCKNFLSGECRRASSCKFRHLTQSQYEMEMRLALQNNPDYNKYQNVVNNEQYIIRNEPQNFYRNDLRRVHCDPMYNEFDEYNPPEPKRRFLVPNNIEFIDANGYRIPDSDLDSRSLHLKHYFKATQNRDSNLSKDARILMLEEENLILHKQIVDFKKQVSDLTATNEFLLDQNAQFRVSNKRNQTNVTSVTVPAVTITNTTVPPNNPATQPPQQVIRTVTASVATVPVSIATVTTGSPGSVVSISGVSMAPIQALPAVSIAQPTAQIIAQNQQLLANPTSQITLTNGSQAQLAIAQQNLANNLAAQQNQPITNQQLTSQAQQMALANNTQLTSQAQQMAHNTLTSQAQQIALANNTLTSQAQQIALANNTLTSQAQLLANNTQLTSQAQQLALAATTPQLIAAQQNQIINTSQAIAMSNATQPLVSYPIMTQSVLQNSLGR